MGKWQIKDFVRKHPSLLNRDLCEMQCSNKALRGQRGTNMGCRNLQVRGVPILLAEQLK